MDPQLAPPAEEMPPTDARATRAGAASVLAASRIGKSHVQAGTRREDAFEIAAGGDETGPWVAAVVADGLGSCPLSGLGAQTVARGAIETIARTNLRMLRLDPRSIVAIAAGNALGRLLNKAREQKRPPKDYSCTLLIMLCVKREKDWAVATFQAGDGLIASAKWEGGLVELGLPETTTYSGEVHPLNSRHVEQTWETRSRLHTLSAMPDLLLVMSDGVADDLVPLSANGPILVGEVGKVLSAADPEASLLELLAYEKKGSFDDRTLVVASLRPPGPPAPPDAAARETAA